MTKKLIALFLSVLMALGSMQVIAAETAEDPVLGRIMVDDNFENERISFKIISGSDKNFVERKYSNRNKSHYLQVTRLDDAEVYLQKDWPTESPDDVVVETDIMLEVMDSSIQAIAFRGMTVVGVSASGAVSAGGQNIGKLDLYTWYNIAAVCNFRTGTYDVYINGKFVGGGFAIPIQEEGATRPSYIRINIPKSTATETTMCIDNFAVYEATAPIPKARREEIANSLDRRSAYYDDNIIIEALKDKFAFNYKSNFVFTNGEKVEVEKPAYIKDDVVYVLAEEINKAFGSADAPSHPLSETVDGKLYVPAKAYAEDVLEKRVYEDGNGLVVVSNDAFIGEEDTLISDETRNFLTFLRPTRHQLKADYEKMGSKGIHPRLLVRPEDITRIKGLVDAGDEFMNKGYNNVVGKAEGYLLGKPIEYKLSSSNQLLAVSRDLLDRTNVLGTAYLLTGDERFAECIYENLLAAATFPDWNHHTHFLDTGEMAAAFAFGYDAIYNYLTPERREPLVKAMVDFCLTPTRNMHYGGGAKYINNWNSVCNGGTAMIAMCLIDEEGYEDLALDAIEKCIRGLEYMMPCYIPDGGWEESSAYWDLAISYMVRFLGSIESVFGTDYALSQYEGFSKTGYFAANVEGPVGLNNYHDSGFATSDWDMFMWFAHMFDDPTFAFLRFYNIEQYKKSVQPWDMFFYDPEYKALYENSVGDIIPLDGYTGNVELISLRSTWADRSGMYVGAHGGLGKTPHWNLDSGTFVLDAMGERFAEDLGSGNYDWPGYINTQSYLYYLKRPEGQNCVVINPREYQKEEDMGQDWDAFSPITEFVSKSKGAYAVMDLTDAYDEQGASAYIRGYKIDDNRNSITIRDEMTLTGNSNEVYWFMHTKANIESIDGDKVILEKNGKRLLVQFAVEGASSYTVEDRIAQPFPQSPQPEVQAGITYGHKLTVVAEGTGEVSITAKFMPLAISEILPPVATAKIADWTIPDGDIVKNPELTNIYVDGEPIASFKEDQKSYTVVLAPEATAVPTVMATGESVNIEVTQSDSNNGTAQIKVVSALDSTAVSIYNVTFKQLPIPQPVEGRERYITYALESADIPQAENPPEHMIDENSATRWSAEGVGVSTLFDLGSAKEIGAFGVDFYKGGSRTMDFSVEVSEDGSAYETVLHTTSVLQDGMVVYPLEELKNARFVRIVCRGGQASWFSVNEFAILGAGK